MHLESTSFSEKKVAIMQPYLFPYLGYFQLIHAADYFVFYDDVQYKKRGWINRNQILVNGSPYLFTLPILKHDFNSKINETVCKIDNKWKGKFLKTLNRNYKKLKSCEEVVHIVESCLPEGEQKISEVAKNSVIACCQYIGINKNFFLSSELVPSFIELSREDRLKKITKHFSSNIYLNLPGGRDLYCKKNFFNSGLDLLFIKKNFNFSGSDLSIIDTMMRYDQDSINQFVSSYHLE